MEFEKLKNGTARTSTGIKELSFDSKTLELRPVLFKVYSGYQPERGTVQGVTVGDIVAQCIWNSKGEEYRIYRFGMDNISPTEQAELWIQLRNKHLWMNSWLEPSGRSETSIPEEIVPKEEYLSTKIKTARIQNLLDRFGIEVFSVEDFMLTRKQDIKFRPIKMDFNPDEYLPNKYHWTGSVVNISTGERWFGSNGNGKPSVELETNPETVSGSNYAYSETFQEDGIPGIKGWEKWKFLVCIKYGVYEKDHYTFGNSFTVYKNEKYKTVKN